MDRNLVSDVELEYSDLQRVSCGPNDGLGEKEGG